MKRFISRSITCLIFSILFSGNIVSAQDLELNPGEELTLGKSFTLNSRILAEEREIYISLPEGYEDSTFAYPVVYVMDAEELGNFQLVRGMLGAWDTDGLVPETIVVGITNSVNPDNSVNRTRDFSPTVATNGRGGGGADTFLRFITDELQPYLESEYRVEPFNILIGHSMSGLFALHALLSGSEAFGAYIAISPSVWWNEGEMTARASDLINSGYVFDNKILFMSLADESGEDHRKLVEVFENTEPAGLDFASMNFPEDSHGTTRIRSLYFGIRHIYDGWIAPGTLSSLEELLLHYENLSAKFGYTVEIPEMEMQIQAQSINQKGDADEIIKIYTYLMDNYPISAETYGGMATGLRLKGDMEEAASLNAKAIEMARETNHPFLRYYLEARDNYYSDFIEEDSQD